MVGPPRRTGARRAWKCQTCRERKVKCDEEEPFCGTCKKARVVCKGFSNPPVAFVPFDPDRPLQRRSTANRGSSASQRARSNNALIPRHQRTDSSIPPLLNNSDTNFREFFLLQLVGDDECSQAMINLLSGFINRRSRSDLSPQQKCIKALTASYYSKRRVDHHAGNESMEAYEAALQWVRKSVSSKQPPQLELGLIMSIMCLSLYENIVVTRAKSWDDHYGFISFLLERRGSQFYHNEENRRVLLAFRYYIIVSSGVKRKHCFLAQGNWKKVIKPVGNEKTFRFDNLLNIAVDVPGLLHDLDELKAGRLLDEAAQAELTFRVIEVLHALHGWRECLPPLLADDGSLLKLSIQTASAVAFHHMVLLLIEELCHLLEVPWLLPSSLSTNVMLGLRYASITPDRVERKHALASDILRLARQSIGDKTPIYGVLAFLMPLHVAHDSFIKSSQDMDAITRLMGGVLAKQHGFHIALLHEGMYKPFEDASPSL